MRILIIANGHLGRTSHISTQAKKADLIVAVDGGSLHCKTLHISPNILIGDFDSTPKDLLIEFERKGSKIYPHPPRKDAIDLELGIDLAMEKGAEEVWFAGVLGRRWDMSFANVLLLTNPKYKSLKFKIFEETCIIEVLHPGTAILEEAIPGQTVSLLVPGEEVRNISLTGFEYPLENETLARGSSRGVSNIARSDSPKISHEEGVLLCIIHNNQ